MGIYKHCIAQVSNGLLTSALGCLKGGRREHRTFSFAQGTLPISGRVCPPNVQERQSLYVAYVVVLWKAGCEGRDSLLRGLKVGAGDAPSQNVL